MKEYSMKGGEIGVREAWEKYCRSKFVNRG
jgi:hypothetical protein